MVATLCVGFTACSDDNDDDVTIPTQGQLTNTSWRFNNEITPVIEASSSKAQAAATLLMSGLIGSVELPAFDIAFNEAGKCALTSTSGDPQEANYTYSNGVLAIIGNLFFFEDLIGDVDSLSFGVTIVGNKLVLELDMANILGAMIEIDGVTKIAIAITLTPMG